MIVYGRNVAKEVLKNNKKVRKIYIQKDFNDKEIFSLIEKKNLNYQTLDKKELYRFEKFSHQGIILDIEDFRYVELDELINNNENSTIVILDHLEDPHNLGAIIRTCEAAGIDGIIIPKNRSVSVNSTVMKTSAGALENVKISIVTNLVQTIKKLKEKGYWIIGTDMEGINYTEIDYKGKCCIIIGNEGNGMSNSISKSCDFIAKIPMYGKINSLNASVAAGIIIYEAIKMIHLKK
ncbi:MAG: 23S rRNA (guanosine(2251)-2'-O)-methyltransferase RlmB [bacterium]|nr:23S rRNA (guanosine(2251)-2'-O)-methyltransferase RlmB [bacterium]